MSQPFVSVLCPTRDRRAFIPNVLRVWSRFDWPKDRLELVIVDDGADLVGDLVEGLEGVRYEAMTTRVPLGTKRNRLVELAQGDLLLNLDDDDYSPPDRVARSVNLLTTTGADVVGKSEMAFYDVATRAIHQYPKIGNKHATAGSMAFTRAWWTKKKWAPDPHTEERQFLDNFTAKLVQFPVPAWQIVLAIAHGSNALPKNTRMPLAGVSLADVVDDPASIAFYEGLNVSEDW